MKIIPLTRGLVATVDDEDFSRVNEFKWQALNGRSGLVYAYNRKCGLMHRFLIQPSPTELVDHRNRITLDNQKLNLRIATVRQNQGNARLRVDSITGAKGVQLRDNGKYRVRIAAYGARRNIGHFDSIEEAREAYRKAATEVFGEFARCA